MSIGFSWQFWLSFEVRARAVKCNEKTWKILTKVTRTSVIVLPILSKDHESQNLLPLLLLGVITSPGDILVVMRTNAMYENLPIILFFEVVKKPDYLIISSSMLVMVNHSKNRSCHSCHSCHWKMQWWSALLWLMSCFPQRKTPNIPRSRSSSWSMAGIPGPWRRFPEWRMHIPSHSSPHQPVCTCLRIRCIRWYRPKERIEKITP